MIYTSEQLEQEAALQAARQICSAARTAPKTKGIDHLKTCVLTGADIEALAAEMERLSDEYGLAFFKRDAGNIRKAQAVVLVGTTESKRGLNEICGYCHFENCAVCEAHNGACIYDAMDLGIAVGSMTAMAADTRVDSRVMFSVGRAGAQLKLLGDDVKVVIGIPLSVSGKSPFFDRK